MRNNLLCETLQVQLIFETGFNDRKWPRYATFLANHNRPKALNKYLIVFLCRICVAERRPKPKPNQAMPGRESIQYHFRAVIVKISRAVHRVDTNEVIFLHYLFYFNPSVCRAVALCLSAKRRCARKRQTTRRE